MVFCIWFLGPSSKTFVPRCKNSSLSLPPPWHVLWLAPFQFNFHFNKYGSFYHMPAWLESTGATVVSEIYGPYALIAWGRGTVALWIAHYEQDAYWGKRNTQHCAPTCLGIKASLGWQELARKLSGGWSYHAKELNDYTVMKVGEPEAGAFFQPLWPRLLIQSELWVRATCVCWAWF